MRNVIAFVVALGIVAAIFWLTRDRDAPRTPAVTSGSATTGMPAPKPETPATVRRLDKPARAALRAQIAAARERARAAASAAAPAGSAPALPDDTLTLEDVPPTLQDTFKQTIPILAECYADEPARHEAVARMTLTTDPELGTVIDTSEITDADGKPLAAKLDACLRDSIESLALPPINARPGKLPIQYSFRFDEP